MTQHRALSPVAPPSDTDGGERATNSDENDDRSRYPESSLRVSALADPVLDALGHDPRSGYVERYWLPVLGPSATLLLRRLAQELELEPDGFELDPARCALELGLGTRGGRHSPFWRTVDRTARFGMTRRNGELLAVRRRLPPLTARQVDRLPEHLRDAHQSWSATQLDRDRRPTISRWRDDRTRHAG